MPCSPPLASVGEHERGKSQPCSVSRGRGAERDGLGIILLPRLWNSCAAPSYPIGCTVLPHAWDLSHRGSYMGLEQEGQNTANLSPSACP